MDLFNAFRSHPDIVEHPKGNGEAKAWCPWHSDRDRGNPSLGINFNKKIVKCFVCGEGGAKKLAKAWGIIPDRDTPPWERDIDRTYDYHNPDGSLRFQVVRFVVPSGADKQIVQRRPDPDNPGQWLWNLKGVQPVLYHLPELRAADYEMWVWIVEGEKDVDRLRHRDLVATTNAMGAGKWRRYYDRELQDRKVAIIPDNDDTGADHARAVARSIYEHARTVKIVELPGLPDKGDVSDWLDDGNKAEELADLLDGTPAYEPPAEDDDERSASDGQPSWIVSQLRPHAVRVTEILSTHGYLVNGGVDAFFFDQDTRKLMYLDKDDRDLSVLLTERYQINRRDKLFSYLLEHILVEAHIRGRHSLVRQFSYYDIDRNVVYLDMGGGHVLRIAEHDISIRDNGQDGVLFLPMTDQEPWEYRAGHRKRLLFDKVIVKTNFVDEGVFDVLDQQLLLELWLVSMAFESMMPTKVIAMAVGPGESGKSTLLRTCGRLLIGPDFDVDSILHDQKGEEDFWVNLSHAFFVAYDNVDQIVRWLPDALAQVATGVRRSKRQLHTTNTLNRFKVSCMVGVTARTPTVSLRREDVAGRTLLFNLKPLEAKRAEFDIQTEITGLRDELMSDYAHTIQRTLRVPLDQVQVADPGMRMADFARVATRIGMGLGGARVQKTHQVMAKLRAAQHEFATEEDSLAVLLGIWIGRAKPSQPGEMDIGPVPNNGRRVTPTELQGELNALAKELDMRTRFESPMALSRRIKNMTAALSREFQIIQPPRRGTKRFWEFRVKDEPLFEDDPGGANGSSDGLIPVGQSQ